MLPVSELFKQKINGESRWVKGMVIFDFAKTVKNYPFASVTATSTMAGYRASDACDGRIRQTDYSITGSYIPTIFNYPNSGWRSAIKSDANGVFSTPQVITIHYDEVMPVRNLWLISDQFNHPVDFDIEISVDGTSWTMVKSVTSNVEDFYFLNRDVVSNISYVRITIKKISAPNTEAFILECGGVTSVVFEDDDIVDLELIEEMQTDAFSLSGGVTSNQFDMTIRNDRMHFLTASDSSPFYKLLRPEVRFKPFLGVRTEVGNGSTTLDVFELVPLGVFYLLEWQASTDSLDATLSGSDLMYIISQKSKPKVRAIEYVTTKTLFKNLFYSMGLTDDDFIIEAGIQNPTLRVGWIPKGDYIDAMAALAGASNCNVYIDRLGKIRVSSKFTDLDSVDNWTDENQILFTNNPLRFNDTYSKVEYTWNSALPKTDLEEVLNYEVTIGAQSVTTHEVEIDGPLLKLDKLIIDNGDKISITNIEYGSFYMKFTLTSNSTIEQKINVVGTGIKVGLTVSNISISKTSDFNKTLQVSNNLVQNQDIAKLYANDILTIASDPLSKLEVTTKGNPAVELKDVILFDDITNKITNSKIFPYYQKFRYTGGLEADVKCIKQIIPKTTSFTGMGMAISTKRKFV